MLLLDEGLVVVADWSDSVMSLSEFQCKSVFKSFMARVSSAWRSTASWSNGSESMLFLLLRSGDAGGLHVPPRLALPVPKRRLSGVTAAAAEAWVAAAANGDSRVTPAAAAAADAGEP